ncbi:precorrin-3B C17-methyltransferase [Salmonella enterica subsp. enterica]|nr:precorrin-3B C17-methyltransferase [Salmonella enterica subsp. enterica]
MLSVIGIGPGSQAMMTMEAIEALQAAEIVVGYKPIPIWLKHSPATNR